MSTAYHYKKGMMRLGPYSLARMQGLLQQAEIGRAHQVSDDGGATWKPADEYPELFQYDAPPAPPPPPPPVSPAPHDPEAFTASPLDSHGWDQPLDLDDDGEEDDDERQSAGRRRANKRKRKNGSYSKGKPHKPEGTSPFAVGGFVCSLVAVVLLVIPCLVWAIVAQSFFWVFNIVIPLGVLAVLGLTLSLIGVVKTKSALSTAGAILGVIAVLMTAMAVGGSATIRYRMASVKRVLIDGWSADIELKRQELDEGLTAFRNLQPAPDETEQQYAIRETILLRAVAASLRDLAVNYDGHLEATALTSEFRSAFEEGLPLLRKSVLEVQRAAEEKNLTLQEVLPAVNADTEELKLLMDTLSLYEKGRLTLQQVEGKMIGK